MSDLKQKIINKFKDVSILKQVLFWSLITLNLLILYFIGYYYSAFQSIIALILMIILLSIVLMFNYVFIYFYSGDNDVKIKQKGFIWIYYALNHLFAFIIGLSIPQMQSIYRDNYALLMIPLLIILNYIILRRFNFYLYSSNKEKPQEEEKSQLEEKTKKKGRPVIEFEGKKYTFSINSLIILAIGAPLVTFLVYFLFDWEINYWLHEIVVKQTVYAMNLLFNMGMTSTYTPSQHYPWAFIVPGRGTIGFETFCTGVQAICVFCGIILLAPHSKDKFTNRDIIWRKTKSLIISSVIFYLVNILRMVIQLYLYYIGYAWNDIHYSISAASSFIAAIIVLLMHKYIPEFIISLIWTYTLIKRKIKGKPNKKEK
ncbi:MAG: hypothetical protein EU541_07010 [Promethearchaeota archaeon]|nr:MAG: hypothetical protein EU541_07010 [Candidatus Lokiarchaeota archaeon]